MTIEQLALDYLNAKRASESADAIARIRRDEFLVAEAALLEALPDGDVVVHLGATGILAGALAAIRSPGERFTFVTIVK